MEQRDDGRKSIEELAHHIFSEYSLEQTLHLVAELAVRTLVGAQAVGVSLKQDGHVYTAASTSSKVLEVDDLQYDTSSGPCLQAMKDGQIYVVSSMLSEKRWAPFTNRALYAGVQSVLSLPLKLHGEAFGVLNTYSDREKAFDQTNMELAEAFAAQSSVVIINARVYRAATELSDQLQEALQSRAIIDQAKGILMARDRISADEAFGKLKRASQQGNIKVREIAQRIVDAVAQGTRPPEKPYLQRESSL